jgi:predicted transcriptional regulator
LARQRRAAFRGVPLLPFISRQLNDVAPKSTAQAHMCYIRVLLLISDVHHGRHHNHPSPPKLRARLSALAKQTGRSAHSLIVEAVERHAAYEEQIRSLVKDAVAADAEIDASGEVYRAEDVHAWMQRLAPDGKAQRPKPWQR